ncbi:MAG TPA: hypothetical protein DCS93_18115 [Microscillaceae bacterium]|nr:hypothetical protein [Microscillaceae bacterium]
MDQAQVSHNLTPQEVETHQSFFEQCAKDYRMLAEKLIRQLAAHLKQPFNEELPLATLNPYEQRSYPQFGEMNKWRYFFHGYHCKFKHTITTQDIEVPLTFGLEFGVLDPYFFAHYIYSTPDYQPLSVNMKSEFADGLIIIEKMLELGLYEKINANTVSHSGVVVTNRDKRKVKVFTSNEFHKLVGI